jgi:hypothetical protein
LPHRKSNPRVPYLILKKQPKLRQTIR